MEEKGESERGGRARLVLRERLNLCTAQLSSQIFVGAEQGRAGQGSQCAAPSSLVLFCLHSRGLALHAHSTHSATHLILGMNGLRASRVSE